MSRLRLAQTDLPGELVYFSGSVSGFVTRVWETIESHVGWTLAAFALILVGAFVGVVVPGPAGVLLGLSIGLLGLPVGFRAARLVRIEREERH